MLAAGCQSDKAGPCQLALAAAIPFTVQSLHMAVSPQLNAETTDMWVDTGAQYTTLSTAAASRLALKIRALPGYFEGIGGRTQVYGFVAHSLQIGRLHGKDFELAAANMGLSGNGHVVDGLLGSDFLAAYDVDVDIADSRVALYKTTGTCGRPVTALGGELYVVALSSRFTSNDPRPHIGVRIEGRKLVALVDTGAPYSALFRDSASRIGLDTASFATDLHFRQRGVGPGAPKAVRHVLTPVSIGELTVSHLPVAIIDQAAPADADMILGMDFMSRVHTWFSFSSRNLVLQYPSLPSPPLPAFPPEH